MRACNFFIASVAMLALTNVVVAQYDESCHYECIQMYCDIFDDYCDYDCHEVCYPYRATKSQNPQFGADGHRSVDVTIKGSGAQPVPHVRHQWLRHNVKHELETRQTGKVVRMRLNKKVTPVPASRVKSASTLTKSSTSVGSFALFQDCLSDRAAGKV